MMGEEAMDQMHSSGKSDSHEEVDLRVHVTGVANPTPLKRVFEYFSQFGQIKAVRENSKRGGVQLERDDPGSLEDLSVRLNIRSGSCIVEILNLKTKKAILDYQSHNLDGRTLKCSNFKTAEQLSQENLVNNKRKVILKKVPSSIPEEELKQFLENQFGTLETIFPFMPDKKKLQKLTKENARTRTIKSYSVMFKEAQSAEKAATSYMLELPEYGKFFVEQFCHDVRKDRLVAHTQSKTLIRTNPPSERSLREKPEIRSDKPKSGSRINRKNPSLDPIHPRSYTPLINLPTQKSVSGSVNRRLLDLLRDVSEYFGSDCLQFDPEFTSLSFPYRTCFSDSIQSAPSIQGIRPSPHRERIGILCKALKAHRKVLLSGSAASIQSMKIPSRNDQQDRKLSHLS